MAKKLSTVRRLSRRDLDALSAGLVLQDGEGRIIDANAVAAPILGLTQDELLGRTSHDPRWYAIHEDGTPWPGHEHPGMVAMRTGVSQRNQLMGVMAPNAQRRWIRIDAVPQGRSAGASAAGVLASFVDVTAEVEQRLRQQQEIAQLRRLAQAEAGNAGPRSSSRRQPKGRHPPAEAASATAASGLAAFTDLHAHLERVQAVARVGSFALGADPDQFTYTRETARLFDLDDNGRTSFAVWFSRVHPEDRVAVKQAWEAALQGAPYDMTYRIIAREQVSWIRARAELHFDSQRRLQGAVGTLQDITDLKAIELELERSRQRLQLALDASALGTWDYDLRTGRLNWDPRHLAMLGYGPDACPADEDNYTRLVHPDDLAAVKAAALAHFSGETAGYESEHRLRHKEGHFVWVLSIGKVVERSADARPLRMLGTIRDISRHKSLAEGSMGLVRRLEQLIQDMSPGRPAAASSQHHTQAADRLTRREREVAGLIAAGLTSGQIAERLALAPPTVITHRRNLMAKLKLRSTAQITRFAIEQGLLAPK